MTVEVKLAMKRSENTKGLRQSKDVLRINGLWFSLGKNLISIRDLESC